MHALIDHLLLGADANGEPSVQSLRLANRHGLIAGATGTGKSATTAWLIERHGFTIVAAEADWPGATVTAAPASGAREAGMPMGCPAASA